MGTSGCAEGPNSVRGGGHLDLRICSKDAGTSAGDSLGGLGTSRSKKEEMGQSKFSALIRRSV